VAEAQQINPRTPPPPPPSATPAAPTSAPGGDPATPPTAPAEEAKPIDPSTPPPPPPETETPATPPEAVFDPLHAERSYNVGMFYLKKGNVDAAIDRLLESAHYEPSLAKPWKVLGEAYEKKGMIPSAVDAYKQYLDLNPKAEDAARIQKRISILEEKVEKESSKTTSH